jgi:hypothetical protein
MATNINKTSNHLFSHTIEYSDGHQYQQNQEVIACFVDIGDHHCIQWYETRGDYLFVDIGDHHCIQWHETRGDCLFC